MNHWSIVPLAIVGFTLAGCGDLPVGKPTIDLEAAQARAAQIDVKTMTRDQVHALMGQPSLASDAFGVEVYGLQGKQRQLMIILGVPMPDLSENLVAYSLVAYGADGRVSAIASDHARGSFPARPTLILRADDFELIHGEHDTLSVSLARYLEVRSAIHADATCTVLIGADRARLPADDSFGFCFCITELSVDSAKKHDLRLMEPAVIPYERGISRTDCRNLGGAFNPVGGLDQGGCAYTSRARVPLTMPEGTHVLHFTFASDADVTSSLNCKADEVTYATLGGRFMTCVNLAHPEPRGDLRGAATVTLSPQAPASDGEPRVVIYSNGTWLYPATSGAP